MPLVLLVLGALWLLSIGVTAYLVDSSRDGVEDENGFRTEN